MKTAELTGAMLDYWVARAEGWEAIGGGWFSRPGYAEWSMKAWTPSTNWAQGGPIIEREKIALWADGDVFSAAHPSCPDQCYYDAADGRIDNSGVNAKIMSDTPLIAAMRAYVASKFGDEVPDDAQCEAPPILTPR